MIHIEGLTKRYGDRVLLEDVSWHVKKRDRIGLSGPNGAGKTTVLRMLAGTEEPDAGRIRMASDTTIGYLPQDGIVHRGRTVHEEVIEAFALLLALKEEQHRIEDALAHDGDGADHERLLVRYAEVTERFKDRGGWEMEARVADVLKGLGFSLEDQERKCEEFSGGWQMRIALAKLLLARPNLLLMDEPTNHLDLPARNWLEDYLHDYPGAVVLVSHDRYFLDATVKRITEVGLRTLTDYHGNYSKYVVEHKANMDRLREAHRRQSEEIEKTEAFINRFRYQATKARQVQSRIKQLDKVERIEIPAERKKIRFKFPDAPKPGRIVLELKGIRKTFGENVVLRSVDLMVERGDRIALVGPNGAGKSTLMRILAAVDQPTSGQRLEGHRVVIDYFAQDQAAVLNPNDTVYEEMSSRSPNTMVPMIRSILGAFLFSGDDVSKKVAVLSGGERNRLALAKMLLRPSNVLLLDEPTNHLDLDSKEVLLDALADYVGTLIFVSHDRYFVDRLATKVIEVGGGEAPLYPGGYEDFLYWKKQREAGLAAPLPKQSTVRHSIEDEEPRSAAARTAAVASFGKAASAPTPVPSSYAQASSAPRAAGAKPTDPKPTDPKPTDPKPADPKPADPKPVTSGLPSAPKTSRATSGGNGQPAPLPLPDPMAPRLRTASSPPDRQERQARERDLKKTKARLADLEKRVAEKEQAVRDLEAAMASPGFYDDRARADQAANDHKALMWEVGDLMKQWEMVQAEVEERQGSLDSLSAPAR